MELDFCMHKLFSSRFKNINFDSRGATRMNSRYVVTQYVPSKTAGKTVIFLQCMYSHTMHARLFDLAYHNMHN